MKKEEKIETAKSFYDKLGLTNYTLEIKRDDEINADLIYISKVRGPGGLIIDDNGEFLFCQSAHDYEYWKNEYKNGKRSN